MEELPIPHPQKWGPLAKDHCDHLLDSIDAHLSRLQAQEPDVETEGTGGQAASRSFLSGTTCTSGAADPSKSSGNKDRDASLDESPSFWKEEGPQWPVPPLLAPEGTPRDERASDSICTEDFAAAFYECLVDPLLISSDEKEGSEFDFAVTSPEPVSRSWAENPDPSQLYEGMQAVLDPHFMGAARKQGVVRSPKEASKGEEGQVSPTLYPEAPLFLGHRPKTHSLEPSGAKISPHGRTFSEETSRATDVLGDVPPGERSLRHQPLKLGEKPVDFTLISRKRGFGCEGLKGSLAWIPDPLENPGRPLLVEDLSPFQVLQTVDGAGAETTLFGGDVPARTLGYGHPEKRELNSPTGLSDVTCLCALPGQSGLVSPGGEDKGIIASPRWFSPVTGCEMQRVSSSQLKLNWGVRVAPKASQKSQGLPSDGWMGARTSGDPVCRGRKEDAPEWMENGRSGSGHRELPYLTERGQMENFRGKHGAAAGSGAMRDPLRGSGQEGDVGRLAGSSSRRRSGHFGTRTPSRATDAGGTDAPWEDKRSGKVSQWEEREARLHLLEDRLSSLRLQLRNAHAELTAMKEEAEKSKRWQEAIFSEKDWELLRLRATISALEAELCDMERLQGEYKRQLERQQDEALREKEKELLQLREALECEKQQVLQEVQSTLLQERKKWEAEARAALQMQREALLEKDRRTQADLRVALEEERKTALALRDETANLHARIQELESQACLFQAEKRVAVEELREQLQKEKEQALRHLRDDLEQERVQDMERMRAKLQEAEEQQGILRAEERKSGAELAERSLAMEVASMARQLQDLLPRKAGRLSFSQGPHRCPAVFSSGHALPAVREICQDTQRYLQELRHEAEVQKHEILPVQKEKGCYPHLRSSCSRLLNGTSFSSQSGFSTPKLLRLLQGQIRELRAEKAGYHGGSPDHLSVFREDLANTDRSKRQQTLGTSPSPLHGKSSWN